MSYSRITITLTKNHICTEFLCTILAIQRAVDGFMPKPITEWKHFSGSLANDMYELSSLAVVTVSSYLIFVTQFSTYQVDAHFLFIRWLARSFPGSLVRKLFTYKIPNVLTAMTIVLKRRMRCESKTIMPFGVEASVYLMILTSLINILNMFYMLVNNAVVPSYLIFW